MKQVLLQNYGVTKIAKGAPSFQLDRTASFGFKNKLNYKIIVNWEIAEHKSQGTMQTYINEGDYEDFWFFDINAPEAIQKTGAFFDLLKSKTL